MEQIGPFLLERCGVDSVRTFIRVRSAYVDFVRQVYGD